MKAIAIGALALGALALGVLANTAKAENRNLQGFTAVGAEGPLHVDVTVGDHYAVDVTGSDADKVVTTIDGNRLRIKTNEWRLFGPYRRYDATIRVVTPRIEALSASRGVTMTAAGVRADHLSISASMGADLSVAGVCQDLSAQASMGAQIRAADLDCAAGDVDASMGAEARVHMRESINASVSMGADVHVAGNPTRRSSHSSMGGDVQFE